MDEFSYDLKIPKDRIAVLIGKDGEVKDDLEQETKTKILVDSNEGDVHISGNNALNLFSVREVIKAIGRGFNPQVAQLLLRQDYTFELIQLSDYAKNAQGIKRIKGRLIGRKGRARATIEDLTDTYIVVYGKTVGIIGEAEWVNISRKAIDSLLIGSTHSSVFTWLEKKRRNLKMNEFLVKDNNIKEK